MHTRESLANEFLEYLDASILALLVALRSVTPVFRLQEQREVIASAFYDGVRQLSRMKDITIRCASDQTF